MHQYKYPKNYPIAWSKVIENPRTIHVLFQLIDQIVDKLQVFRGTSMYQQLISILTKTLKCLQEFALIPINQFSSVENKKNFSESFATNLTWFMKSMQAYSNNG